MVASVRCGISARQPLSLCATVYMLGNILFCVCVCQDENTRALVFYLEHAKNARLEFPVAIDQYGNTKMLRYFMIFHHICARSASIIFISLSSALFRSIPVQPLIHAFSLSV